MALEPLTRDDPGEIAGYRIPRGLCAPRGIFALVRSGPNTMNMAWQDASDKNNVAAGHLTRTTPSG